MAKIIRFPLKMKNGAEVRTLDELKENFDLESVLGYFADGKLVKWLSDRYCDEKAEAVAALSTDMPDLNAKLCEILEVEYQPESDSTDMELIAKRREKLKILSAVTDNRDILDNVDLIAMSQDELYDILDEDTDKVYLYGDKFEIPFGRKNVCYIGINNPLVSLGKDRYAYDYNISNIKFSNVKFEEGRFYPEPVGKFEIEDGVLKKGIPDENGQCIIPYGVTSIQFSAFYGCEKLTSVTIPDSVTSIGALAFHICTSLTNITIPSSVTSIGEDALYGTLWFEAKKKEKPLVIVNNILIDGRACSGAVDIPYGVISIGEYAFGGCISLESITIPDSVARIGYCAFSSCTNLESVILPDGIKIEEEAFIDTPWGKRTGIGQ